MEWIILALNIVLAIAGFFAAFVIYGMRSDIQEAKQLASKAHAIEVLVASQYITRDSHDRSMDLLMKIIESNNVSQDKKIDALFRKLDLIESKIEDVHEKAHSK